MRPGRLLVLALLLLPFAGSALAAPSAGQYRYLYGTAVLRGSDGATWNVWVAATQPGQVESAPENGLFLDVERCVGETCTTVGSWSRPLASSEVSVAEDLTSGTLRTTLFGAPLQVALTGGTGLYDQVSVYVGGAGIVVSTTEPGASPNAGREKSAQGTVDLLGLRCPDHEAALAEETYAEVSLVERTWTAPPRVAPRGLRGRIACA